jgi:hypothetical protein
MSRNRRKKRDRVPIKHTQGGLVDRNAAIGVEADVESILRKKNAVTCNKSTIGKLDASNGLNSKLQSSNSLPPPGNQVKKAQLQYDKAASKLER